MNSRSVRNVGRIITTAIVALAVALAAPQATAADYTWTNATTGTFNWDTTTNWSGSTVPVNGDTGTIFITNRAASYTVTFNPLTSQTFTSSTATQGLQVGSGGAGSGTVTFSLAQGDLTLKNGGTGLTAQSLLLQNGGVFNLSGSGTLNTDGLMQTGGAYNQSGGVANLTASPLGSSRFFFGNGAVTSTNTLSGGAMNVNTASTNGLKFGIAAGGNVLFLINGGTMTQTGATVSTTIGERGAGTVRITSGAFSHASQLDVGPQALDQVASTSALLDVQGGTATNAGTLNVGQAVRNAASTAAVTQSGGSFTQSGTVNLGISNTGSMTLSGGTFAFTGSTFQIGSGTLGQITGGTAAAAAGVGVLTISNGLFTGTNSGTNATINVGRTANDGANTGNLMSIVGGTATMNTINVYRGGTFSVSSGSATVNRTLQISGASGTGGGLGQVSGGFLAVTNSATSAALTIEKSGTFQVTGGSVTANVFTGTAAGATLLVQEGTMTVTRSSTSTRPITVGGGAGVANLALVGPTTSYNSTAFFSFTGGTAAGITIQNNGLVSSQGRLAVSSPIVIQSGGTMSLTSAAGATTNGVNDGQLSLDSASGSLDVQAGGAFSARSAIISAGARLNVTGGQFTVTRVAGDGANELRFTGANTGFTVSSGTLSMTSTSSVPTIFRLGGNTTGATSGTLSGGAMNLSQFLLGDRGGTFAGDSAADATFTMTGGTLSLDSVASGGLYVGNNPQSATLPFNRGFFNQSGGVTTNNGLLQVGVNTQGAVSLGSLSLTSGTFTQVGVTQVGVSGSGTGVVGTLAVSGGRFATTGAFFVGGTSSTYNVGGGVSVTGSGVFTGTNAGRNVTVSVSRTANDATAGNNTFLVDGGTAAIDVLNVYRSGTFTVSAGQATVNSALLLSGTTGGAGAGRLTGGTLLVQSGSNTATFTVGQNASFVQSGGSATVDILANTASGGTLLVQGGTMTVTGSSNSTRPITVGGGSGAANLAFVGSSGTYNSNLVTFFNFTNGTAGGITIQNNGLLSSQGRLSFNSPIVIQSGGTMNLASAAGAATTGVNDGQLALDASTGSLEVQAGGAFSARSASLTNGARLNVSGGQFTMTRAVNDGQSELRFSTGANSGFVVSSGTLSMTSTSTQATTLRMGGFSGSTSGTLSGGAMNLSQFLLGDRGGTFAGSSAADATFTMTGGTLSLDNVQGGGLYVGNDPLGAAVATDGYNRGFFNQSGGVTTNSGVLQLGINTKTGTGGVSLGSLSLTSGTFTQAGVTQVGVSGTGTGVVGTMAVSGGRFSTTGAFFVGGTNSTYNVGGAVSVTGSGLFTGTNAGRNVTVSVSRTANDATAGNNTFLVDGGTATIDVLNVYRSGTFTVSAGQATVNSALLLSGTTGGAGAGRLTGGTLLVQSGSNTATFTVGQNASFVQSGGSATVDSATITAAGANFALQAGTFTAGGFSASQPVAVDGTLNLNGATASIGAVSGAGTIGRSAVGSGILSIGDATNSTFAGSIANALGTLGLTKTGAGALTLTGTSTYAGATTVSVGSLLVNGQLGSTAVTVNSGATLGGSGSIGGSVTNNGLLSPGNSPGQLSLADLVLGGTGTVLMEIQGTTAGGQYDQISLTGSLTYGGVMQLDLSQTFADNTSFNLFTGFTAGSGDFSSITSTGSAYTGLSFTRIGNIWTSGTAAGGQSLEFNQTTGTLVIVPEPAALALAGLGIAVAAWARRRRTINAPATM
jgi:fibronectin-binding autotransporter adhesin